MDRRRIIMPPTKVKLTMQDTILVPDIGSAMSNGITIIANELAHYCSKTARGVSLDLKEARAVREYIAALVMLSKEAREAAKADDLSSMSNEDLLALATKLVGGKAKEALSEEEEDNKDTTI